MALHYCFVFEFVLHQQEDVLNILLHIEGLEFGFVEKRKAA